MGECCSNSNYPKEKKIYDSFKKIEREKNHEFNIINYDEKCNEIYQLTKDSIKKLGSFQNIRVNLIEEFKKDLYNLTEKKINNNYLELNNQYSNFGFFNNINGYLIDETQKILFYIIIMKLIYQYSLKGNFISNELEKSLMELSIIILKKNYTKNELKLILYYLSKIFEILFPNICHIEAYLNLSSYISKINYITNEPSSLIKEEKYLFIETHIISLGEWFHNDFKSILINELERVLLIKYYTYLLTQNYDFIINNYSNFNKIISLNKKEINPMLFVDDYYNKNDLMVKENIIDDSFKTNEINVKKIFFMNLIIIFNKKLI